MAGGVYYFRTTQFIMCDGEIEEEIIKWHDGHAGPSTDQTVLPVSKETVTSACLSLEEMTMNVITPGFT